MARKKSEAASASKPATQPAAAKKTPRKKATASKASPKATATPARKAAPKAATKAATATRSAGRTRKAKAAPKPVTPKVPTQEQIAQRAYELWLAEGQPDGRSEAHWVQAQDELSRV